MGCLCGRFKPESDGDGFVDVDKYIGNRDLLGRKSGKGQYYYANGDMYDGQWDGDKKHGYGCYTYANGDKMKGYFDRDAYVPRSYLQPDPSEEGLKKSDSAEPLPRPPSLTKEQLERKGEAEKRIEERQKQREIQQEQRRVVRESIRKKWLT